MKTKQLFTGVVAGLMMLSLSAAAGAQQAHVDRTVGSITKKKPVPVTWRNYTRADTDFYFKKGMQIRVDSASSSTPAKWCRLMSRWSSR